MQTKKRKMKAGEALVGMKRRGSQLWDRRQLGDHSRRGRQAGGEGDGTLGFYLRRQNILGRMMVPGRALDYSG